MKMKKAIFALAASAVLAMPAYAVQGTIKTEKDSKTGDIKWQGRSKSYSLTYKRGTTNVSAEYPLADVVELDIEKPKNLEQLISAVQPGQGAASVAGLSAIVQNYRMLVWDKPAARWLVKAYLAAGQAQKAYETARGIISDDETAAYSGELAPAYWETLLKTGKATQLENCLKKAASSGDRATSAEALLMRGDMILAAEGDNHAAHRKALTDSYLRVALMYNDPKCRDVRRDALLKCAASFDKLGQGVRAENMKTQAKSL